MAYEFLYEVSEGVATLTFNRPQVMNALTFEVYHQLRDLFEALRYDEVVHTVVLTGAGDNFCSGGDVHDIIGELLKRDMKEHLEFTRMTGAVVQRMRMLDKPIIAALNGMTAGAGAVIALASDLAIAMTKHMLNRELSMDLVSAIEAEAQAQALMLMGEDHRRFYEAFKAKEKPSFTGR